MASESVELRTRAEAWRMLAKAYELHVLHACNSPAAQAAYEAALAAADTAYLALTGAADALDEDAGMRLPGLVRRIPIRAGAAS